MPDPELVTPDAAIVNRPVVRTACDRCGEEIINEREVIRGGSTLCRSCAGDVLKVTGAGQTSGSASVSAVAPAFEDRLDRATRSVAAI